LANLAGKLSTDQGGHHRENYIATGKLKFMFENLTFGTNRRRIRHKRATWLMAKAMPAELLFHRPQGGNRQVCP
jgi:hypothetical protein